MKNKIQRGFTLIELMIVVAIIGVLAAFAIPAYNDYITRTQVAEVIELLSGLKVGVAEHGADKGAWPTKIVDFAGTGGVGASGAGETEIYGNLTGKYSTISTTVANFAGGGYPKGQLVGTVTYGRASGKVVTLSTANGGGIWVCGNTTVDGVTGTNTTVPNKWLPNACK